MAFVKIKWDHVYKTFNMVLDTPRKTSFIKRIFSNVQSGHSESCVSISYRSPIKRLILLINAIHNIVTLEEILLNG